MSRGVYLLGVGIALLGVGLAFTDWVLSLRPGVTEANFKRIRTGMTVQEREAILGGPGTLCITSDDPKDLPLNLCWRHGDEGSAWFSIGGDARVHHAHWFPSDRTRPGPLDRLRAWLGL